MRWQESFISLVSVVSLLLCADDYDDLQAKGWGIQYVYHGELPPTSSSFHGQLKEDIVIDALFSGRSAGFFVDLAANDAIIFSNTYYLEVERRWKGLCIEPNPQYAKGLLRRKCKYVQSAVSSSTGDTVDFTFRGFCGGHGTCGGVVKQGHKNVPGKNSPITQLKTVSLEKILVDLNCPSVIDLFSFDVEGHEDSIMENFPWEKFIFKVIIVEEPKLLTNRLIQHQYRKVGIIGKQGLYDEVWVNLKYEHELNISAALLTGNLHTI